MSLINSQWPCLQQSVNLHRGRHHSHFSDVDFEVRSRYSGRIKHYSGSLIHFIVILFNSYCFCFQYISINETVSLVFNKVYFGI